MAAQEVDDLIAEAPPSKRARVEEPEDHTGEQTDDMDDIYSTATNTPAHGVPTTPSIKAAKPVTTKDPFSVSSAIPGLELLRHEPQFEQKQAEEEIASNFVPRNPMQDLQDPPNQLVEQSNCSEAAVPQVSGSDTEAPEAHVPGILEEKGLAETKDAGSPSVTNALEALLGGLTPPSLVGEAPAVGTSSMAQDPRQLQPTGETVDMGNTSDRLEETHAAPHDFNDGSISSETQIITQAAEQIPQGEMMDIGGDGLDQGEAEFELDSSPIESSSDDSDSDDSSSSEDSDEDGYKLLGPEEQARILMEGDGGSDDEGGGSKGAKGSGGQLRTKNEVPEEVIPKPDVSITAEMRIDELGEVEAVVESILLIKAKTSGEYRVLESGSVLCLADRSVIGVVAETLGRVQQPLYSVRFTNADEIAQAGLVVGTKVYYSEQHATYVFTKSLKAYKGSDASNLHDEEVGDEEMEFSDDEAEAEHKKRIKQKKMEKRGGRMQQNGGSNRGGHPLQPQHTPYYASVGLSYDDEDDGPYKPLARPAGFADTVGRIEAPQERVGYASRMPSGGREDNASLYQPREHYGRGRGRGDRGRGRGRGDNGRGHDRGRGRGCEDHRNDGYSQPPRNNGNNSFIQPSQVSPIPPNFPSNNYDYSQVQQDQYNPHQPHFPPHYSHPPFQQQQQQPPYVAQYQQPYPQTPPQQPSWPNIVQAPPMAAGTYINPAFFGNQQQASGLQWATPALEPRDPEAEKAFNEAQERLNILRNLSGNRSGGQQ